MKPQSWSSCDEDIKEYVTGLIRLFLQKLDGNLVGVYLHGSLAMGSYYRPKSDLDLLIVIKSPLGADTASDLGVAIAQEAEKRPTTGNVELSIITADIAKNIPVPTPYELHYSTPWHDKIIKGEVEYNNTRTDIDLLSHLMYVKQRGICLQGKPIADVFGEYDWRHFMDAVIDDFKWIVDGENILQSPFYAVLNICRVLQLHRESSHIVHSKDEGGEWGLINLPAEYRSLIRKALGAYRSPVEVNEENRRTAGQEWEKDELLRFRDYARQAV